jgi:hypothetical protein
MVCVILVLGIPSVGIMVWGFVSMITAFRKFNCLDKYIQEKLLLMDYYMAFVRRLSTEELVKFAGLPDEEIEELNEIEDMNECIRRAREKINT